MGSVSPVGWLIQLKVSVAIPPSGSVTVPWSVKGSEPLPPGPAGRCSARVDRCRRRAVEKRLAGQLAEAVVVGRRRVAVGVGLGGGLVVGRRRIAVRRGRAVGIDDLGQVAVRVEREGRDPPGRIGAQC